MKLIKNRETRSNLTKAVNSIKIKILLWKRKIYELYDFP